MHDDFCTDITGVSLSLHTTCIELHIKENMNACERLQIPYIEAFFEAATHAHSEQWGFPTINKIKSFYCLVRIRWRNYHQGQCDPRVGGNYLQQRLSFTIYCRWAV